MTIDKLNINNEMAMFDSKRRSFYDELTDDEKKKFSPFILIRWGSCVGGSAELQSYYVVSTNENLNKHFFDINTSKHKKLQWLMCTTVSPGMGNFKHQWIKANGKTGSDNKTVKFFREQFPTLKEDDIQVLAKLNDKDDIKRMARELGWDDKRIKSDL